MVAAPPPSPPILGGDLKTSDQNNWGEGDLSKKLNWGGGAKFKGGPKILGGSCEPQWCHECDDIISSFLIETNNK